MAKPKTMGDPLKLRIPLRLMPYLRRAAQRRNHGEALEAQRIVTLALQADADKDPITVLEDPT